MSDVLEVNVQELVAQKQVSPQKTLVVGNLPYYITSPILRKFFTHPDTDIPDMTQQFAGGIFMVQDEVGQKVRSDATKKSFLRWLLNY